MATASLDTQTLDESLGGGVQKTVNQAIDELMASLPDAGKLTPEQRRGIIARYTAVLEGNFIYWMTGAYIAAKTDVARGKIMENLHEEVRDSHPGMMRRFALAAHAAPTDTDFASVYQDVTKMRLFIGRLSGVRIVVSMAFFEGFIQRFMAYLQDLAERQGSKENEYTVVHGVCDITHTQELFNALDAEMAIAPPEPGEDLFEGMKVLRTLIHTIVQPA